VLDCEEYVSLDMRWGGSGREEQVSTIVGGSHCGGGLYNILCGFVANFEKR